MSQTTPKPKVALVTGASSGFGRLIAARLSASGYRTFGTSRSKRPDQDAVEMLELNVCDDASVQRCVERVLERAGSVDVLVNNAGVLDVSPAEERSAAAARELFETNFFGAVRVTNAVLPGMRAQKYGRILNIGSLAALIAPPGEAAYAASKAALTSYAEALSYEVSPFGVSVSVVHPGFYRTEIGGSVPEAAGSISDYDSFRATIRASIEKSLEGGSDPLEVADLVARIVQAKRPRLSYRVGSDAVWLPRLRRMLPEWAFARGVRRAFGL